MPSTPSVPHAPNVRYHGLDALRAWAMSMGIVLHAAWIMTPGDSGAPMTDASASPWMEYLAGSIHMFRMQLFFVLAGFFACLLVRKRGTWKFSSNRFWRVVVPLVLFWTILRPPMTTQFNAAQLQSGAIQADTTAWELTKTAYRNLTPETVFTMHLWFIYYLSLTYVLILLARSILGAVDRGSRFRDSLSNALGWLFLRSWSVAVLALVTGAFMFFMDGWSGVEMDPFSLYPHWLGLLCYVAFFSIGWFIFRNAAELNTILRGWRWQLAAGIVLTVPYFFFSHFVSENGYQTSKYPNLTVDDIHFNSAQERRLYPEMREKLLTADSQSIAGIAWQLLPQPNRSFVQQNAAATDNQLSGLLMAINISVIANAEFASQVGASSGAPTDAAQEIHQLGSEERSIEQVQRLNREILQADFANIIWSEDRHRPYYIPLRAAYSFLYSLATWLLIFGCLGFSQNYFSEHSRFWRYFSDASYWMYLMHLVVQFQILLWVGDQPWHWALKFSLYVVGTLAVLVPSYHLLVRPTWLGWLLNGRILPLVRRPVNPTESTATGATGAAEGDDVGASIPAPHFQSVALKQSTANDLHTVR